MILPSVFYLTYEELTHMVNCFISLEKMFYLTYEELTPYSVVNGC